MRNLFRLLGIIAVVAIIGFGVVACDDGNGGDTSCTHTWVDGDVITAATCDTAGSQKQVCSKCGAEGTAKTLSALGHQWDEDEANWVTTAATCEVAGGTKTNCTRPNCTATEARGEAIPALGHLAPGGTPATCTTPGNTGTGTCTRPNCGQEVTGTPIPAYGHTKAAEAHETVEPTCTEDGTKTYRCVRFDDCGYTYEPEKGEDKLGHTKAAEPYATTPPTCTEDGTKTYRCVRFDDCEYTFASEKGADKLGHNISGTYQYNDTQHWQVCQNPGCTEEGTRANHTSADECTVCDFVACVHDPDLETGLCNDCGGLTYNIGDTGHGGGIIYYRSAEGFEVTGNTTSGYTQYNFETYTAHYLEAAPEDLGRCAWGRNNNPHGSSTIYPNNSPPSDTYEANVLLIGKGRYDTVSILKSHVDSDFPYIAARVAYNADFGGKNDWFLPSLSELWLYYLSPVDGKPTPDENYVGCWSSSVVSGTSDYQAWLVRFYGIEDDYFGSRSRDTRNSFHTVLAIRAF